MFKKNICILIFFSLVSFFYAAGSNEKESDGVGESLLEKLNNDLIACSQDKKSSKDLSLPCQRLYLESTILRFLSSTYSGVLSIMIERVPKEDCDFYKFYFQKTHLFFDRYEKLYLDSNDTAEDRIALLEEFISEVKYVFTLVELSLKTKLNKSPFSDAILKSTSQLKQLKDLCNKK